MLGWFVLINDVRAPCPRANTKPAHMPGTGLPVSVTLGLACVGHFPFSNFNISTTSSPEGASSFLCLLNQFCAYASTFFKPVRTSAAQLASPGAFARAAAFGGSFLLFLEGFSPSMCLGAGFFVAFFFDGGDLCLTRHLAASASVSVVGSSGSAHRHRTRHVSPLIDSTVPW